MIRVLIVRQCPNRDQVLARAIWDAEEMCVVGEVPWAANLPADRQPDCDLILLDVVHPGDAILQGVRRMSRHDPGKVVVVGANLGEFILQCLQAGAMDYVLRDESQAALVHRLRAVHQGTPLLSPVLSYRLVSRLAELSHLVNTAHLGRDPLDLIQRDLTPRQREVLGYLAQGYTNRMIAEALVIATGTVKNHVHHILRKLNVANRREAAALALSVREERAAPRAGARAAERPLDP